jgi:hypothetical protein
VDFYVIDLLSSTCTYSVGGTKGYQGKKTRLVALGTSTGGKKKKKLISYLRFLNVSWLRRNLTTLSVYLGSGQFEGPLSGVEKGKRRLFA